MSIQVDTRYINVMGSRLRNFHKKGPKLWNYSCPLCGDSQKDKNKARGYFYQYKGEMWSKCWNCNEAMPFGIFLWKLDKGLHEEYSMEKFVKTRNVPKKEEKEKPVEVGHAPTFDNVSVLKGLRSIASLPDNHPAKEYILKRQIPEKYLTKLFLVSKFMAWTNSLVPDKFPKEAVAKYDAPRLVIPYYDVKGRIFAYSGRSFDPNDPRKYIIIKLDEDMPKVFGLDTVNPKKRVYELEGPLDAMFLENAVAMSGVSGSEGMFKDNVKVLDNDRRNKHVGNRIKKLILLGEKVCLWSDNVPDGADINDLIKMGWSSEKIKHEIDSSTYSGLEAQLEFERWRKY